MKILEIIPNLACGGAENFIVALCNEFARQGHEVTLLTFYPRGEGEFLYDRLESGVKTDCIGKRRGVDLTLSFRLRHYINRGGFDIAHFHVQAVSYSLVAALTKICGCVATIHNDAYVEATGLHRLIRKILFRLTGTSAVTISAESDRTFKELYATPSTLIYNGIAAYHPSANTEKTLELLASFRKTPSTCIFVNIASVTPQKNQVRIASAINRLAAEGEDVTGVFLGRITNENYGIALKEQCSDHVKYLGEVSNPRDYLAGSDFFVLTSEYEGMPISLLEAFSTGTIPIVSAVGGCRNLVRDNHNGFVTNSTSVEDITEALRRACHAESATFNKMKQYLSKEFEEYTIAKCADRHIELFRTLVEQK